MKEQLGDHTHRNRYLSTLRLPSDTFLTTPMAAVDYNAKEKKRKGIDEAKANRESSADNSLSSR